MHKSSVRLRKIQKCALLVLVAVGLQEHPAHGQRFSTESGTAEFTSSVPLYEFKGTSDHLTGVINLADSTVDFFLDLETLKTGIGKRDKDMRITLETDKHPFAEFYGKLVTPFDTRIRSLQRATAKGRFSIHGVSRDLDVTGTLSLSDNELVLRAAWPLNLKDYSIVPPRLLIVKVDEIQEIRISATLLPVEN